MRPTAPSGGSPSSRPEREPGDLVEARAGSRALAPARGSLRARRRGRRTGARRPPISWPCSCPLPAITTTSPASASSIARGSPSAGRDRSPRRGRRPGARPAMIASGSSLRGLSEVTTTTSARSTRDPAHQRPLAAVAVAARAEDDDHAAPPRARAPAASAVVERLRRVRVVDEDGERLSLVDRLEASRHAADGGDAGRDLVRRRGRAAGRRDGAEHVLDVEQAAQRRLQVDACGAEAAPVGRQLEVLPARTSASSARPNVTSGARDGGRAAPPPARDPTGRRRSTAAGLGAAPVKSLRLAGK